MLELTFKSAISVFEDASKDTCVFHGTELSHRNWTLKMYELELPPMWKRLIHAAKDCKLVIHKPAVWQP